MRQSHKNLFFFYRGSTPGDRLDIAFEQQWGHLSKVSGKMGNART